MAFSFKQSVRTFTSHDIRRTPNIRSDWWHNSVPVPISEYFGGSRITLSNSPQNTVSSIIMKWFDAHYQPKPNHEHNLFALSIIQEIYPSDEPKVRSMEFQTVEPKTARDIFHVSVIKAVDEALSMPVPTSEPPETKEKEEVPLPVPPREGDSGYDWSEEEKVKHKIAKFWGENKIPPSIDYQKSLEFVEELKTLENIATRWNNYKEIIETIAKKLSELMEGYNAFYQCSILTKKFVKIVNDSIPNLVDICNNIINDVVYIQCYSTLLERLHKLFPKFSNLYDIFDIPSLYSHTVSIYERGGPQPMPDHHCTYVPVSQIKNEMLSPISAQVEHTNEYSRRIYGEMPHNL